MSANLPVSRDEAQLVVNAAQHADHDDPQQQEVQQNLRVAILPLAIAAFVVLGFVVAAWTFLAAG